MRRMKLFFSVILLAFFAMLNAQKEIPDSARELLFDPNGAITRVVATEEEVDAKIITVNPLLDDVPWRKVVLRVIDLREEQNKSLYYPEQDINENTQKNLFSIIFYNFFSGKLVGYEEKSGVFEDPARYHVPLFIPDNEVYGNDTSHFKATDLYEDFADKGVYDIINYLTKSCVQYLIQEAWYFDKHTSTFHSKILAIAPVFDANYNDLIYSETKPGSVFYWFPYEKVRPFLQEEYLKMSGRNTQPLFNFDDFFTSRQFYSYIVKDFDLQGRAVTKMDNLPNDDPNKPYRIREEEERIEAEILDFEQDLWNY